MKYVSFRIPMSEWRQFLDELHKQGVDISHPFFDVANYIRGVAAGEISASKALVVKSLSPCPVLQKAYASKKTISSKEEAINQAEVLRESTDCAGVLYGFKKGNECYFFEPVAVSEQQRVDINYHVPEINDLEMVYVLWK